MSETLRKPWIREAVLGALARLDSRKDGRTVSGLLDGGGQVACPVEDQKYVQITNILSRHGTTVAIVSDKISKLTVELSKNALESLQPHLSEPLGSGTILRILESRLQFMGADGMLFEEGISLQDQLWDLLSAVEGARKPSKDHISNCFKTVPTVELRLVIESVRYTTLERTILGNPKDVATYNEIKSRLRKIPLKKDALRAVQPKPEYAHLLSLPLSSEDRPASSLDSSNHQSEDVAEKNTSMQTSSSSQDEETDEEESQFATQAITQLRNKKRSRKTKRSNDGSFDSFDDLDFDEIASTSAPRNIARKGGQSGRKSNVKRKNKMDTFSDLEFEGVEDMAVVPRKGSLANSDGSSRQRKKIGGPVAKKSGILQRPASSSSSSGSEDSGSDSSWSGKSYVSATEAYIPRDQQKRLDAPESWYPRNHRPKIVSGYDLISKVQPAPKRPPPRSPSPVPSSSVPKELPTVVAKVHRPISLEVSPSPEARSRIPTPAMSMPDVPSEPVDHAPPSSPPPLVQLSPDMPIKSLPAGPPRFRKPSKHPSRAPETKQSRAPSPGNTPPDTIRLDTSGFYALQNTQSRPKVLSLDTSSPPASQTTEKKPDCTIQVVVPLKVLKNLSEYEPQPRLSSPETENDTDVPFPWSQTPPRSIHLDSPKSAKHASWRNSQRNNTSGIRRCNSESNIPKPRRKKNQRSQTSPISADDEEEDSQELIVPDCPEPIVNPFGQTRLQVYGMLGAQRVNMWSERRERRRRKQAIIDSEDDEIASSEDDVQHDKSVKTGTRSKTLNLEDDPIESTAEPQLQREPSMPAPGALQLNGDDEPVQSQLTAREEPPNVPVATSLPPNFRVEEESISSALEKEPEVPPEDGPIPNAVLSNSDPPITNTTAAPRFPTKPKSTFLTGQGHRSVISKNASAFQTASDSDEDDFPSIPIVPLGRAIPARLPPTTRNVLAPEKEQNKALEDPNSRKDSPAVAAPQDRKSSETDAARNNSSKLLNKEPNKRTVPHFIPIANVWPSTAPNPQRPLVQVKRTPYSRSRSFVIGTDKGNSGNQTEDAIAPTAHLDQQSSAELPDRQVTSFELLASSGSMTSTQDDVSVLPGEPTGISPQRQPVIHVKRTPHARLHDTDHGPKHTILEGVRNCDESFVPATNFDLRSSTDGPEPQHNNLFVSSGLVQPDNTTITPPFVQSPATIPGAKAGVVNAGPTVEDGNLNPNKRRLQSPHPDEGILKKAKTISDVNQELQGSTSDNSHQSQLLREETASQEPLPTLTTTAAARSLTSSPSSVPAPLQAAQPIPPASSPPTVPSPGHSTALSSLKRSPPSLNITPLQPKRSRHDMSISESSGARIFDAVLGAPNAAPVNCSPSLFPSANSQSSPSSSAAGKEKEIPASLSSGLGEFIHDDDVPLSQNEHVVPSIDSLPEKEPGVDTGSTSVDGVTKSVITAGLSTPSTEQNPPDPDPPAASTPAPAPEPESEQAMVEKEAPPKPTSPILLALIPELPAVPIILDPSYAGIRPRRLAIPGYERLSGDQKRKREDMKRKFFGVRGNPNLVSVPKGDEHNNDRVRQRLQAADNDRWWCDEGTPMKLWVESWSKLKSVRKERGEIAGPKDSEEKS